MSGNEDNIGVLATGSRVQQYRHSLWGKALSVGSPSAWRQAPICSQVLGGALQIFGTLSPQPECRQTGDWPKAYGHQAQHGLRISALDRRSGTSRTSRGDGPTSSLTPFFDPFLPFFRPFSVTVATQMGLDGVQLARVLSTAARDGYPLRWSLAMRACDLSRAYQSSRSDRTGREQVSLARRRAGDGNEETQGKEEGK
jgi:hypothetical protein